MTTNTINFTITLSSSQTFNKTFSSTFDVLYILNFLGKDSLTFTIDRSTTPEKATASISLPFGINTYYGFEFFLYNYLGDEIILGGTDNLKLSASGMNIKVINNNIPMVYEPRCTCFMNTSMSITTNNQLSINKRISANEQNKCMFYAS